MVDVYVSMFFLGSARLGYVYHPSLFPCQFLFCEYTKFFLFNLSYAYESCTGVRVSTFLYGIL